MFVNKISNGRFHTITLLFRSIHLNSVLKNPRGVSRRPSNFNKQPFEDHIETDEYSELDIDNFEHLAQTYVKEVNQSQSKIDYAIVKEKYFKENFPNFLYWQEKEHIRFLHASNPDEWTVEKLAASFPVLPETIKKILKSNWNKSSPNRVQNHNRSVEKNWQDFRNKKLQLPQHLEKHLKKFAQRKQTENIDLITNQKALPKPYEEPKKIKTTFYNIVASSSSEPNEKKLIGYTPIAETRNEEIDPYLQVTKSQTKLLKKTMTHDFFKEKILQEDRTSAKESTISNELDTEYQTKKLDYKLGNKNTVILRNEDKKDLGFFKDKTQDYPDKIKIPKKVWQKGKLFRVDDCYYDDDGEFLYRVLGMGIDKVN